MSTIRQAYGPQSAGRPMSVDEFESPADWDESYVYELIDGVLVVNPAPEAGERGPNELLGNLLFLYRQQHPDGAAMDYTINEHMVRTHNLRRADRAIWAGLGRMPNLRRDLPAIVIEFVSKGRRNRKRGYEEKRDEYLQAGITEYWIIDRFARQMTVAIGPAEAPDELVFAEDATYSTPLLPGFGFPLAKLFAEADLLERAQDGPQD